MYAATSVAQVETYPDLWRKGRYRVELKAELAGDCYDVDAALDQLGYEVTDADQWGRSYRHRDDPRRTAELDEAEAPSALVSLILRQGDLDDEEIPPAEGELDLEYGKLYGLCCSWPNGADDGRLHTVEEAEYVNDLAAGGLRPKWAQGPAYADG